MKTGWAAAFLCLWASPAALAAGEAGAEPSMLDISPGSGKELAQLMGEDAGLRSQFSAMPAEEKKQFLLLFAHYRNDAETMKKKGWSYGWFGNLTLNTARGRDPDHPLRASDPNAPENQSRNAQEAGKLAERLRRTLQEDVDKLRAMPRDQGGQEERQRLVNKMQKEAQDLCAATTVSESPQGLCTERASFTESSLKDKKVGGFRVRQIRRQRCWLPDWAKPYSGHSAVEVQSLSDPSRSFIFDSWHEGEADVFTRREWLDGCQPASD